jgi:peptidyl-tRNA hydrolase, PTH1 family
VWVVVGLGNPGRRYETTRHNMGFRVVDRLAGCWRLRVEREAHRALVGEARRNGERVLLVKPQTHMNASGAAVASLRRFYRFGIERLMVVHDDVDLEPGRVRIRRGGGSGGNRGVESVIAALEDAEFLRVKIGVGRPPGGWDTADYVLAVPEREEATVLAAACARAAEAVDMVIADGAAQAMNRINQRERDHGGPPL